MNTRHTRAKRENSRHRRLREKTKTMKKYRVVLTPIVNHDDGIDEIIPHYYAEFVNVDDESDRLTAGVGRFEEGEIINESELRVDSYDYIDECGNAAKVIAFDRIG